MSPDTETVGPMEFTSHRVVEDAKLWWALTIGDVNGDGLQDIVYIDNNGSGGHLGYRAGTRDTGLWEKVVIAEAPPTGGLFAAGDLETGDMDGDGDTDVLAVKHTGEWDNAAEEAEVFWYENPGGGVGEWTGHAVGIARGAVKDLSVGDFDGDGRMDIAVLTFENENLRIHRQRQDGSFTLYADLTEPGLHEGMDVGDLDGDGDLDVAANGYVFLNDNNGNWTTANVHDRWHNQTGDWSANGTKNFVTDMDGDGTPEIFISHSERGGYPLAVYHRGADGSYSETLIVDTLPAAHTLQVFDMDGDGDKDIVTGINKGRAVNLDPRVDDHPVIVLINNGSEGWGRRDIEQGGIYNGRVADLEGDGDMDIFRLSEHQATDLFVLVNQTFHAK